MAKFSWSSIQSIEVLERSRSQRFRPELREILTQYFGLAPGMRVLDVGCGPGTFTTFLAGVVAPGEVTGLDLDEEFIAHATAKASAAGIPGLTYVVGDAYALPFADQSFDAVTSYTGIGVLTDPPRAVAEMLRVCRPGGWVSVAEGVLGPAGLRFDGVDALAEVEPYPGARRLHELTLRLRNGQGASAPGTGSPRWPRQALWALLPQLGLEDVELNAWGHVVAPDDHRTPPDLHSGLRAEAYEELQDWVQWLLGGNGHSALRREELEEILVLLERRRLWALEHPLWDWEASLSLVARGRKPGRLRTP